MESVGGQMVCLDLHRWLLGANDGVSDMGIQAVPVACVSIHCASLNLHPRQVAWCTALCALCHPIQEVVYTRAAEKGKERFIVNYNTCSSV